MFFSFEINPRLLVDNTRESTQNFRPIYSYEQEPLVSLGEACHSLENMLGIGLRLYITVAKLNSTEPKHGLTQDESAAIYLYTMEWTEPQNSLYVLLNQALCATDKSQLEPWNKYLTLFLTALFKLPYSNHATVWRGVAKDISGDYRVGDELTWWSLTSITSSFDVLQSPMYLGREKVQTIFAIETKYGKSIREHSHLRNDDEILLLPGIVLKVTQCSKQADGIHKIHLRDVELFDHQPVNIRPQFDHYCNPRLEEIIRASKVRGSLSLDSMNLNDQDMEIVVKLGIVEKKSHALSLRHNAITSVGASVLSQVFLNGISIYALNLDGNRILDTGVQFLCRGLANQMMGMKFLYLNSTGISDTGCGYLAEMLQVHRSIIYLHLDNNEISDRGVRVLLETTRSPDSNLSLLILSANNRITDASADIICSAMSENRGFTQLQLRNCGLSPAGKERLQIAARQTSFVLYV